jgi:CHAT domain-containing protein
VKDELEKEFKSGSYQFVHISTHSYFGHSADESYIMAYKEILKADEAEEIMQPGRKGRPPVELATFSACETAVGDGRAPPGFSGLAIKARARNAIGALWPINDKATRRFMEEYYSALSSAGDKAAAPQDAQLAMLKTRLWRIRPSGRRSSSSGRGEPGGVQHGLGPTRFFANPWGYAA